MNQDNNQPEQLDPLYFENVDQLTEDCWLFFKGNENKKTITKTAFVHEVSAILEMVKQHEQKKRELAVIPTQKAEKEESPEWIKYISQFDCVIPKPIPSPEQQPKDEHRLLNELALESLSVLGKIIHAINHSNMKGTILHQEATDLVKKLMNAPLKVKFKTTYYGIKPV